MNTNQPSDEVPSTPMRIFIHKNGEQQGPFTLDEVLSRERVGMLLSKDHGWIEGEEEWIPLGTLLRRLAPPPPPKTEVSTSSQPETPKPEDKDGCVGLVTQPMLNREDALMWITVTTWIYIVLGAINAVIGLVPIAVVLVGLALWLRSSHSRFAAIALLSLAVIAFLLSVGTLAIPFSFLTLFQIMATARGVEATYKLRRPDFR